MADDIAPEVFSWLGAYAAQLGVPPPGAELVDEVLALAAVAARGSARQAAPVACWLAATAGVDPAEALERAQRVGSGS